MKKKQSPGLYLLLGAALFFLDRITKFFILKWGASDIRVAPFLSFRLQFNRGISWGMLHSEGSIQFIAVSLMTVAIIIPLAIYARKRYLQGFSIVGETLALVGATSNLVDRVLYGGVVDFISFSWRSWSWPIFNIADACIVSGIFLIILSFSKEG